MSNFSELFYQSRIDVTQLVINSSSIAEEAAFKVRRLWVMIRRLLDSPKPAGWPVSD